MNLKTLLLASLVSLSMLACSSEEETTSTEVNTEQTGTKTTVNIHVLKTTGVALPGYEIHMFDKKFTIGETVNPIKIITSDTNGLASFDLQNYITEANQGFYYFEAFKVNDDSSLSWFENSSHLKLDIKKNNIITTSIYVNID